MNQDLNQNSYQLTMNDYTYVGIYLVIFVILFVICRKWVKKYKNIPDKEVTAKLIETSDDLVQRPNGDGTIDWIDSNNIRAKYEYFIDNKRHTIFLVYVQTYKIPEEVKLLYKKGARDIRYYKRNFRIPGVYIFIWFLILLFGTLIIAAAFYFLIFGQLYLGNNI